MIYKNQYMLYNEYFDWLTGLVFQNQYERDNYLYLLDHLNHLNFYYSIPLDANRYSDGIDLRTRFCYEKNIDYQNAELLGNECSVLEMMIALAFRCENNIMSDPAYGDRTGMWFWIMIQNLGLSKQNNAFYDPQYINNKISVFLNREYEPNGEGGLFIVDNAPYDMREVEIWCQLNWYLSTIM